MELVIHSPRGRLLEARGVIVRDRRAGDIGRRGVFRGGTMNLGLIASLSVLDCTWQRGRVQIVSMTNAAVVGRRDLTVHRHFRAEPPVTEIRPVTDLSVANADDVGQAVA